MNWRDEPASEKQLSLLGQYDYLPDGPMTKGEASDLITQFSEDPEKQRILEGNRRVKYERENEEEERNRAYHLHLASDEAKQEMANADPSELQDEKTFWEDMKNDRVQFWQDTIGEPEDGTCDQQAIKLYLSQGHRFQTPSNDQIQAILDALDASSATWDRDMPEYFFSTLELNFPELLRTEIDFEALEMRRDMYTGGDEPQN
ncbi:MAG: hypothetical protein ABSG78_14555 [Verrucomicrobiota bacterium]|jgi:hypothetical protein